MPVPYSVSAKEYTDIIKQETVTNCRTHYKKKRYKTVLIPLFYAVYYFWLMFG